MTEEWWASWKKKKDIANSNVMFNAVSISFKKTLTL